MSQFSKLRQDISTQYAGKFLLEAFYSAKLCVKGGIENGPITGNGHKMEILNHFCCHMRVLSAENGFFVKKHIKISDKTISTDFRFLFLGQNNHNRSDLALHWRLIKT